MKKVLLMAMVVAVAATAANAMTIGLKWTADNSSQVLNWEPADGEVFIDVVATLYAGETLNGMGSQLIQNPNSPDLWHTTILGGALPNTSTTNLGVLGDSQADGMGGFEIVPGSTLEFVGLSNAPGEPGIAGPGTFVLGQVGITPMDVTSELDIGIMFADWPTLLDATGTLIGYAPAFSTTPGYGGFDDWGSPGRDAGPFGADPVNPLIIHVVPEPGTLALLALGGLALIRRR
jgi:hypothetical protein